MTFGSHGTGALRDRLKVDLLKLDEPLRWWPLRPPIKTPSQIMWTGACSMNSTIDRLNCMYKYVQFRHLFSVNTGIKNIFGWVPRFGWASLGRGRWRAGFRSTSLLVPPESPNWSPDQYFLVCGFVAWPSSCEFHFKQRYFKAQPSLDSGSRRSAQAPQLHSNSPG